MDFLTDWLTNWLKELLISGIMGNLEGLFDTVNAKVGEIAVQVNMTSLLKIVSSFPGLGTLCPEVRPLRCSSSPHKIADFAGAP